MADLVAIGYPDESTGMGALMGKMSKTSIDRQFQDQVRDMLKPGTSSLFLMLEKPAAG